ncbi:hypothetical protein NSB25_12105 [Acetatifactor muris]|uniref:Uncharacterized protein n=1 Tax=Acetatifactor muris TaxID=879566 RepID=A0A2K4ZHF1_9FIRM|nr:hypothetical protein [Acetatifactor muris]MCR2048029.1 hypothetical protein [Acetatifactor muris]SOY29897.1 hypothetical protein AMURIS_02618 [Acetatifactor muris]
MSGLQNNSSKVTNLSPKSHGNVSISLYDVKCDPGPEDGNGTEKSICINLQKGKDGSLHGDMGNGEKESGGRRRLENCREERRCRAWTF